MRVIGLTGGIGSGKSAVAACFEALGAPVIDTDAIAHELTGAGQPAVAAIAAALGAEFVTAAGALDRARLRRHVFADAQARRRLEAVLHPPIRAEVERRIAALNAPYAVVVIPLLAETGGYPGLIERVVVVDCPQELQIERAMRRSGLAREEVLAILRAQAERERRLALADDVIVNDAGLENLRQKVAALHHRYLQPAVAAASSTRPQ